MKRIHLFSAIVLLLFLGFTSSCSDEKEEEPTPTTDPNTPNTPENTNTVDFTQYTLSTHSATSVGAYRKNIGVAVYNGIYYVIGQDKDYTTLYVYKYDGNTWSQINSLENDYTNDSYETKLGIVTDASGNMYYCFGNNNSNGLAVKKYNGSTITTLPEPTPATGWATNGRLVIYNNTLYVAYLTVVNYKTKITVKKYNGSSWDTIGTENFSPNTTNYMQFDISSNGTLYVAFGDKDNGNKLKVMKFDGSNWVTVGSGYVNAASGRGADNIMLKIAPNGTPYVGYDEVSYIENLSVRKFDGTNWVLVGNEYFLSEAIVDLSMTIAPNGVPYIAYQDINYSLNLKKFNGTSWVTIGSSDFTHGFYSTLLTASDNSPILVYSDWSNSGYLTIKKGVPNP